MKHNILLLCDFNRNSANTIIDHATSFKKYSRHNVFSWNPVGRSKPVWLNLNKFDCVVIHYSIYLLGNNYLDYSWRHSLDESPAIKILFIQDEYRRVNAFIEQMRGLKIHILYTCFPEEEIEKVYPKDLLPGVRKINTLTGYVPSYMENSKPDFDSLRPIDVGYRGRGEGLWWLGHLYQEKSIIGREFLAHARHTALKCDISTREEDRIYGKKWIKFLRLCRCTLGTESGASVIDFTGDIEIKVRDYCETHPSATFGEVRDLFFKDVEGTIRMNQISPRAFEAIGCGCCMILFEGDYSGILEPGVHYIELKKDFHNIQTVLEMIRDRKFTTDMAKRAYEDIILPGTYSYKSFVASFDDDLANFMSTLSKKRTETMADVQSYSGDRHPIPPHSAHTGMTVTISSPSASPAAEMRHIEDGKQNPVSTMVHWVPKSVMKFSKLFHFIIRQFIHIFRTFYYILRLFFHRVSNAVFYRFCKIHSLSRRLRLYHPFFLVEKLRLITKIIRQM